MRYVSAKIKVKEWKRVKWPNDDVLFNPNWHEAGHFPPFVPFGSDFWQLNFYQKFPNFFGGEN